MLGLALHANAATNVVLHLKNGDRVAGTIISEDTNRVVIATSWISELAVPQSAIERREASPAAPAVAGQTSVSPATTNAVTTSAQTNVVAAVKPPPPKPPKHWKADITLGTDLAFGSSDRQLYYGRTKFTYALPYKSDPKKFFRSILDYSVDYGRTDGILSANRMAGSFKMDFDVGKRVYVYNLAGAGYDEIRKIELQYEEGPGVGYHLFTLSNFVMNVEAGVNYQVQEREDSSDTRSFYLRLAEDLTWKLNDRVTFTEKFEFFPNIEDTHQFRARFDSTLSYKILQNLSLNLTVLDLYDSHPANGVDKNELQIRSSLGITF